MTNTQFAILDFGTTTPITGYYTDLELIIEEITENEHSPFVNVGEFDENDECIDETTLTKGIDY